jgi:hypothetical protein
MKKLISVLFCTSIFISAIGQSKTIVTINGEKVIFNPITNNGLTSNTAMGNVELGGNLIKPTMITTDAVNTLEINSGGTPTVPISAIKITDGSQGSSKVLTSDPTGRATWQAISGSWAAYAWAANKLASGLPIEIKFNNINSVINGVGGSFDGGNGRIYVPKDGLYRIIIYVDFNVGTPSGVACGDIELRGFNSNGTSNSLYNCDNVGARDNVRKNGYMQAIGNLLSGGYITVRSTAEITEGVISIELIK